MIQTAIYESIVKAINSGIIAAGADGNIDYINSRALTMLNLSRDKEAQVALHWNSEVILYSSRCTVYILSQILYDETVDVGKTWLVALCSLHNTACNFARFMIISWYYKI